VKTAKRMLRFMIFSLWGLPQETANGLPADQAAGPTAKNAGATHSAHPAFLSLTQKRVQKPQPTATASVTRKCSSLQYAYICVSLLACRSAGRWIRVFRLFPAESDRSAAAHRCGQQRGSVSG